VDNSFVAIALLTDFGTRDHFVASMKGVILSIAPAAAVVDITHDIVPQDIRSAAFTLAACFRDFPTRSIFVAVVDPGVGSRRRAIAVDTGEYCFVGPDNGVLSFALQDVFGSGKRPEFVAVELANDQFFNSSVSNTFHGRDIFAPVAAFLSNGTPINVLGPPVHDLISIPFPRPSKTIDRVFAEVVNIDRFGNVVTNLKSKHLREPFQITVNSHLIGKLEKSYAESNSEELFAIEGSLGLIELSVRDASAADVLKARIGDRVALTF
jgi:S-adenosylmethionine hydrolase